MEEKRVNKQIRAIRVKGLFGLYSYELPERGYFSDAAILYGDNGVGKSTLLRLVYHLLSAAESRGHRSALYQGEFQKLEVDLSSGVNLIAEKVSEDGIIVLKLAIYENGKKMAAWNYVPQQGRHLELFEEQRIHVWANESVSNRTLGGLKKKRFRHASEEFVYLAALGENVPATFILNAERRLDSDTVPDPSDEVELRKLMHYESPKTVNDLLVRSREIALSQALSTASKWISQKVIIGTNQGSTNVHSVYVDVLQHVMSADGIGLNESSEKNVSNLEEKLTRIEERMRKHAEYQLAAELNTTELRSALGSRQSEKAVLAADLLKPYIESLEKRLEAVDPIYAIIDAFVKTVNNFLKDKEIRYRLSGGFEIWNRLGNKLSPSQLSSGEQQLLLLFCYVLTARDEPSVFMIDEPEISLNIKWQRQLIDSLLKITKGSDIQFIFASHSMELLAQHGERVVKLIDRG